jgi:prophage antirepressor-like protein
MNAITPFVFEDNLVRSVIRNSEPWFVGKDVCHVLGLKDHKQALEKLDEDERGRYNVPTPSGDQMAIIISEPGVFRLIFTSRKAEAERFKRWLAHDVLPTLRRTGAYEAKPSPHVQTFEPDALPVLTVKLAMVREARQLWGHDRARAVWQALGLMPMPENHIGGQDEALECLNTLLDGQVQGRELRDWLADALEGDDEAFEVAKRAGLWAEADNDGFAIANRSLTFERILQGTRWAKASWQPVLRRLHGTTTVGNRRYEPNLKNANGGNPRGVFMPAKYLDFTADR